MKKHDKKIKKKELKKISSIWKYEDVKLEFSNPSIEAMSGNLFINDISQIMYYYYELKLYNKDKETKKWKKLWSTYTYDAPALIGIPDMIDKLVKNDFDSEDWQKNSCARRGAQLTVMCKSCDSMSLINEDDYCFKRITVLDEKKEPVNEEYRFYVGKSDDLLDHASSGLLLHDMKKSDIIRLKHVAEEFIEKSISYFNELQEVNLKKALKRLKIAGDKSMLYCYSSEEGKTHYLNSIFVPGDIISELNLLVKDKSMKPLNKDIRKHNELSIKGSVLKGFHKNKLILEGGYYRYLDSTYKQIEGEFSVPLYLVYDIYIDIQDDYKEKLSYNEEECYKEFSSLLKTEAKTLFRTTYISDLEEIWINPLINRFWMMRDEHEFKNPYRVAKNIIYSITEDCFKSAKKEKNDKK